MDREVKHPGSVLLTEQSCSSLDEGVPFQPGDDVMGTGSGERRLVEPEAHPATLLAQFSSTELMQPGPT